MEKQIYNMKASSTVIFEVDGYNEKIIGCTISIALDEKVEKSKYFDADGNFNIESLELMKMAFTIGLGSVINMGEEIGVWLAKDQIVKINNAVDVLIEEPLNFTEYDPKQ